MKIGLLINSSDVPLSLEIVVSLGPKFYVKSNILYINDIVDTIKNLESKLSIVDIDNNPVWRRRKIQTFTCLVTLLWHCSTSTAW